MCTSLYLYLVPFFVCFFSLYSLALFVCFSLSPLLSISPSFSRIPLSCYLALPQSLVCSIITICRVMIMVGVKATVILRVLSRLGLEMSIGALYMRTSAPHCFLLFQDKTHCPRLLWDETHCFSFPGGCNPELYSLLPHPIYLFDLQLPVQRRVLRRC